MGEFMKGNCNNPCYCHDCDAVYTEKIRQLEIKNTEYVEQLLCCHDIKKQLD